MLHTCTNFKFDCSTDPGEEFCEMAFTIYSCNGHLGHVNKLSLHHCAEPLVF